VRKKVFLLIVVSYCFCFIISNICAETGEKLPAQTNPEHIYTINGVEFWVYAGAEQAAKNSGVRVDLKTGILHTPKGEVKAHDLTINNVTRVSLMKNELGNLIVVSAWRGSCAVFLKCSRGTVVSIYVLEINQVN
jgi:hypothetical protein